MLVKAAAGVHVVRCAYPGVIQLPDFLLEADLNGYHTLIRHESQVSRHSRPIATAISASVSGDHSEPRS